MCRWLSSYGAAAAVGIPAATAYGRVYMNAFGEGVFFSGLSCGIAEPGAIS